MSAQEQMRAMLDQLMGTARDGKLRSISEIKITGYSPTMIKCPPFLFGVRLFSVFSLGGCKSKRRRIGIATQFSPMLIRTNYVF